MMKNKSLILAAGLALAAGMTGCSAAKSEQPAARVKLSVSSAAVIADVMSIKVTIDDNGAAPTFSPAIDLILTKAPAGNVWTGNINQIPANPSPGSLRRFKAEAFTGAGAKIYEGDTIATVIAGQTAEVAILLQELNVPPGPVNFAPVISALTSTSAFVAPGTVGSSSVVANDPDNNGNPLAYLWSASCVPASATMVLGTPAAATTSWTAPSVDAVCTVAIKVSETVIAQPLSVTTYFTVTVNAAFGDANIAAFPNSYPIVTARGDFRYNFFTDVTTIPVGQQGDLFFTAFDPDGDNVRFDLSLRCKDDTAVPAIPYTTQTGFFSAASFTTMTGGTRNFLPTFGHPQPAVPVYGNPRADCEFTVTVQDLCTGGNCGAAGAQGALADGSDKITKINGVDVKSFTTGLINATHPAQAKRAPVIVRTIAPNQLGSPAVGVQTWDAKRMAIVQPGVQYLLQAEADDRYEGGTLLATWTCVNGTFVAPGPVHTGNLRTSALWTAPAALTLGMQCTVSFQSVGATGSALSTVATFQFAGSDPCVGATDGTVCNDGNLCTTGETCQASVCTAPVGGTVICTAQNQCTGVGVCNPLDGQCSNPPLTGTACDDGNACTTGDLCSAGTCAAGTATVCTASGACFDAGVCNTTTGLCSNPPSAVGTACTGTDLCFQAYACNGAGTCTGSNPVSCAVGECILTAGTCNPTNGACVGGVNQPNGTACTSDGSACTTDACSGGVCTHTSTCAAGQSCDNVLGCVDPVLVNQSIASIDAPRPDGLSASGTSSFLSMTGVFLPAKTIAGVSVAGAGASDVTLVKYNMTTGATLWAKAYGDDLDQFGKDSTAETLDGTVAVVGRVAPAGRIGECVAGPPVSCSGVTASNAAAYEADFLMLVNSTTGAVKVGTQAINNGISGQISAVAVNPALNLIAVCGVVNATSSLCQGTTPASCTPATAFQGGNTDLLVAVFNSAGVLQWARQVGSSTGLGDESCNSIAIDVDGTVFAVGKYQDELNLGTGALPSLNNSTAVRHMWVGHFDATGATLASTAFGTTAPALAGNVTPNDLELDLAGNLVVGGSFTVSFPVGSLVSIGGTDAFVAKISPALTGIWGVRLGNTGSDATNSVGIGPSDSIVAVGSYAATVAGTPTTGAAALTAPSGTAGQMFQLKLNGATGATASAGGFGDAAAQLGTEVAVAGSRVQTAGTYLGTLDLGGGISLTSPVAGSQTFSVFSIIQ